MSFITKRKILFGDCDPAGFIYTPRVSYFVVESVHEFLADVLDGPAVRRILDMGILPPVRKLTIDFLRPLVWDDVIEIEVNVIKLTQHSFEFTILGRTSDDELAFQSNLTQVCVSPETKRPVELPEELRNALSKRLNG